MKTLPLILTKQVRLTPCFIFKNLIDKSLMKKTNCYSITENATVFSVSIVKIINRIKLLPFFQENTRIRLKKLMTLDNIIKKQPQATNKVFIIIFILSLKRFSYFGQSITYSAYNPQD